MSMIQKAAGVILSSLMAFSHAQQTPPVAQTACAGRFQIDLPPRSIVVSERSEFGYAGMNDALLSSRPSSKENFLAGVERIEKSMEKEKFNGFESSLMGVYPIREGKVLMHWVTKERSFSSRDTLRVITNFWRNGRWFNFDGEFEGWRPESTPEPDRSVLKNVADEVAAIVDNFEFLSWKDFPPENYDLYESIFPYLRSYDHVSPFFETMPGPGFCAGGGYVRNLKGRGEKSWVSFVDMDHVDVRFSVITEAGSAAQIGGFKFPKTSDSCKRNDPDYLCSFEVLRRGRRTVDGMSGDELFYIEPGDVRGEFLHRFVWIYAGVPGDVLRPAVMIQMNTGALKYARPSVSNKEAMALWEAAISSFKFRK